MEQLKKSPVWINWIYFATPDDPNNRKKIPINPKNTYPAKVNKPDTWGTIEQAQANVGKTIIYRNYKEDSNGTWIRDENGRPLYDEYKCKIEGIGFTFANGICGIDIDNKKNQPELEEQAKDIINFMNTYTEYSPSSTGYHLVFKCDTSKIPTENTSKGLRLDSKYYQKNPKNGVECYFSGITNRYFTYTGESINTLDIEDRTEEVLQFLEKYMKKSPVPSSTEAGEEANISNNDIISIARAEKKGNNKFVKLFDRGDISGYRSESEADIALCNKIAFYAQGDFDTIDTIFKQSALYLKKSAEHLKKWERNDYRTNTINNAIALCKGKFYTPPGRPKKEKTKDYAYRKLTIAGVREYLQSIEVEAKYNEISRRTEIQGLNDYNDNYIVDSFPVLIYDQLNLLYEKCPKSDVQDFLKVIMMNNAYNPVTELIDSNKWDGVDRLSELYEIMRIDDNDSLSKILIKKWLWQNLSMARNESGAYGADGILVLKGEQAVGKTSFARKMALKNEWFGEGLLLDVRDKDTVIRAVSCWIGELGEIESTFKSDINALKAFISSASDKYRVPYGRIAEDIPRRTSFIGTCNSDKYLIDETGNRRYWTIPIAERMDLDALEKFDMLQLYLQIDEQGARNNIQGYRLTPEENSLLAKRNSEHEKPLKSEIEVRDIIEKLSADNRYVEKDVTVTEFKSCHKQLDKYSSEQIGRVLDKMEINSRKVRRNNTVIRVRRLPMIAEDFLNPEDR